jgi:hypothetical protein
MLLRLLQLAAAGALVSTTHAVPEVPADVLAQIEAMRPEIDRIVEACTDGDFKGEAWRRLADFTDTVGNRISGSAQLDMAIDYMVAAFTADGFNAFTEPALVPSWHRGADYSCINHTCLTWRRGRQLVVEAVDPEPEIHTVDPESGSTLRLL